MLEVFSNITFEKYVIIQILIVTAGICFHHLLSSFIDTFEKLIKSIFKMFKNSD